jgi:hypothetical protein
LEGPIKAHQNVLENVARFFPMPHSGVVAQHLSRQQPQAFATVPDQLVPGRQIPCSKQVEPGLELFAWMTHKPGILWEQWKRSARLSDRNRCCKNEKNGCNGILIVGQRKKSVKKVALRLGVPRFY